MQQAFFAVNQPTRSAVLPKIVEPHLLPAANSLNMTVGMAGGIAGPLVGGALIPLIGFSWLYLLDTITLFATLGAVVRLPPLPILGVKIGLKRFFLLAPILVVIVLSVIGLLNLLMLHPSVRGVQHR